MYQEEDSQDIVLTAEESAQEPAAASNSEEPAADSVVPDANQYKYQKDELAAFVHFGPNTFNEIEWGENYGDSAPSEIFKLSNDFDADTLVKTLKNAGFKKLIITAKHHDGFCLWASDYTTYDVASTNYKNGQGDILAEISAACTEYDMDMGLYLSPWDIHEPSYGYYDENGNATDAEHDVNDYNEYYNNQLQEILGSKKYGNNGHFVEVWMDGAKGSGANAQEYDFEKWFATIQKNEGIEAGYEADCMLFGAEAYTTVRWIGNESGLADEDTWAKSNVNYTDNTIDSNSQGAYTVGYENGNKWTVPECDGRITSGWFWGTSKNTPKTITQLAEMYFGSVGHNSTMLLNIPPNSDGTVDQAILDRVEEFGENIAETFRTNLAKDAEITADHVRGDSGQFAAKNVVDGDDGTYWTTNNENNSGTLTIKWDSAKKFDVVSIEEAIQKGQRINSYTVKYKTSDDAEWKTLKSGTTIGAKRLIRTSAVSATQVQITVSTPEGKVPLLSEVGIYKASEGFQLAGSAPEGMEVVSVNDSQFAFEGYWTRETGVSYINGHNIYCNSANSSASLTFTGTKVYVLGTQDPNHGAADVYIDGEKVASIDTKQASRSTGMILYVSDDLSDGEHTLKLVAQTNAALGLEAAYVINNGGAGMIGFENASYTMNENAELTATIKRVGGTKGTVTAKIQPNPGSAIQDDYNTEWTPEVTFADGEKEKTLVIAKTRRNTKQTKDQYFTVELTNVSPGNVIVGFSDTSKIVIRDMESFTIAMLQSLVDECDKLDESLYCAGWDAFEEALDAAKMLIAQESASGESIGKAYDALETAKAGLKELTNYSEEYPFEFPTTASKPSRLEAELATEMINSQDDDSNPDWPLKISTLDSNPSVKFINCLAYKDYLTYAYYAKKAGTYHVVMRYKSGGANQLTILEENGKIEELTIDTPSNNNTFGTLEFDLVVKTAGTGLMKFTCPSGKQGPDIDYLTISSSDTVAEYTVKISAGTGGTVTADGLKNGKVTVEDGGSLTVSIQAADGYQIKDVLLDGVSKGAVETLTLEQIKQAHTIKVSFEKIKADEGNEADDEIESCDYIFDTNNLYVPYTEANPTTVSGIKHALKNYSVSVWSGSNELTDGDEISENMIVRVAFDDKETKDYKIVQKNVYYWDKDPQSSVWHSQKQNVVYDWVDITEYDSGNDHAFAKTFRAPKSGVVSVSLAEGAPTLNASEASSDTVTLSLKKNDETACQTITFSNGSAEGTWMDNVEIHVSRGDQIRLITTTEQVPAKTALQASPVVTYVDNEELPEENVLPPEIPTEIKQQSDASGKTITITWEEALDEVGIKGYYVYVDGVKIVNQDKLQAKNALSGRASGEEDSFLFEETSCTLNFSTAGSVSVQIAAVNVNNKVSGLSEKMVVTVGTSGTVTTEPESQKPSGGSHKSSDSESTSTTVSNEIVQINNTVVRASGSVATGDASDFALWFTLLLAAFAGSGMVHVKRKEEIE